MEHRGIIAGGVLPSCALMAALLGSGTAFATTYNPAASTPQSKSDGLCSLYEAAQAISTGKAVDSCPAGTSSNTINLGKGVYTLTSGITLNKDTVIQGTGQGGASGSTIHGTLSAPFQSMITVSGPSQGTDPSLQLKNLALDQAQGLFTRGIYSGNGAVNLSFVRVSGFSWGGIVVEFAALVIEDSTIENNTNDAGGDGGGIFVNGDPNTGTDGAALIFMRNSSVLFNETAGNGGGLFYRGNSNSNLYNVTFGGNVAEDDGGGIYVNTQGSGYLDSYGLTIANNSAGGRGGGIRENTVSGTPMRLHNSIVNDNFDSGSCPQADGGVSSRYTFYSSFFDSQCGMLTDHDTWGINAQLGPLMDMGGNRTRVYPLLRNSPPKDTINFATDNITDQRGFLRPIDWDGNGTVYGDAGAFEYNPRWEAEQLVLAASSGETHAVQSGGSYSQGKGIRFSANGINDYVKYELPIAENGNYKVSVGVRSAISAGTFQLSTATSLNGSYSNIGGTVNLNGGTIYYEVDLTGTGTKALTQGLRYFQAKVTTCPAGGCPLYIDYIKVRRP